MIASVISLGCPKNLVDSEHILGILGKSGYELSAIPEEADVIIINTCGFLQSAVEEAEGVIRRCLKLKVRRPYLRIIVCGCLVQRMAEELRSKFPDIEAFLGIDQIALLPKLLNSGIPLTPSSLDPSNALLAFPALPRGLCDSRTPRLVSTPSHYAYLRIADGCDNCCAYCLIPSIRGHHRSRPMNDIVREAELLARAGAKELILIAQDTTQYGLDRYDGRMLDRLLRRLSPIAGVEWLRILYTHPAHYTPELIQEIASNPKVAKYVDLPLQHINRRILKKMNRPGSRVDIERLLTRLQAIPDMALRTTFITGFPGETEQEFDELRAFVKEGHFTHVGCFAYSPEPGTRAQRMSGQVPNAVRELRARELMKVQRGVSLARNRARIGTRVKVLIDGYDARRKEFAGRTQADAPEIDDTTHVTGKGIRVGEFVEVRIRRASAYRLTGDSEQ